MKVHRFLIVLVIATVLVVPTFSQAVETSVVFTAALTAHFAVSAEDVAAVWETEIAPEEIPVAFFLADLAKTSALSLAKLRARGDSWLDIAGVRNIGAAKFYMVFGAEVTSKAYAPILKKYAAMDEDKWGKLVLTNEEVVNLVNLKFISSHYDYNAFEVMAMRDKGDSFVDIAAEVKMAKAELLKKEKESKKKKKTG